MEVTGLTDVESTQGFIGEVKQPKRMVTHGDGEETVGDRRNKRRRLR